MMFLLDEKFNLINVREYREYYNLRTQYNQPSYRFEEFSYDVDLDLLAYYTLAYTGLATTGIRGDWRLTVEISDANHKVIVFAPGASIDDMLFEFMSLSPLGVNIRGSFIGQAQCVSEIRVELETPDGLILLDSGFDIFLDFGIPNQPFASNWQAVAPIDIDTVTAVVINNQRIPIS
jgi:hypothetical protein